MKPTMSMFMIFVYSFFFSITTDDYNYHCYDGDIYDDNDDDDSDDDELVDEDQNGHYSANFQARSYRFCMVIDLYNTNR